jgi:hypothetical protein
MEARKWLRQQPEHFCAAGFDALVKRWDKCVNVGGGYVEKYKTCLLAIPRSCLNKICKPYLNFDFVSCISSVLGD